MGWSTQIVVARHNGEFYWNIFSDQSIEIIDFNKTYLAQYMWEVIDDFPLLIDELRVKTDDPKYDDGDGYHYSGWYYCKLTKEILEELSKPDIVEKFADMYQEHSWGFRNKKERREFIKEWKEALKACRYLLDKYNTHVYWVEG